MKKGQKAKKTIYAKIGKKLLIELYDKTLSRAMRKNR